MCRSALETPFPCRHIDISAHDDIALGFSTMQTGHKMGGAPEEIKMPEIPTVPIMPDLLAASTVSDYEMARSASLYGLPEPVPQSNGTFDSEHHLEETYNRLAEELRMRTIEASSAPTETSSVSDFSMLFPTLASQRNTTLDPHERLMAMAASEGIYPKSSSSMSVDTPLICRLLLADSRVV